MKRKSSTTMPVPLQIVRPDRRRGEDGDRSCSNRELQIVDPASSSFRSGFNLPSDWVVEERPRKSPSNPGRVDKYYHEPGTGKIFRSLTSVKKYLTEEPVDFLTQDPSNVKNMQIVVHTTKRTSHFRNSSSFKLPEGWTVVEKRRKNINYKGVIDRYYIEPGTGYRFRSLRAVERHLNAPQEGTATGQEALESGNHLTKTNLFKESHSLEIIPEHPVDAKSTEAAPKGLEPSNPSTPLKDSRSGNKHRHCEGVKDPLLDFCSTPPKIKWVFNGSRGNAWSPSASGSLVQESVKQKWSQTFASYIQERS